MFIQDLYQELNETFTVVGNKLNALNTSKENVANKRNDLTSTNNAHYPSVPAVKAGDVDTLASANAYTDLAVSGAVGNYIPMSQKGAQNGVAPLGADGIIGAQYLPSFVDDVVDIVDFVTAYPVSGMVAGQKWYNTTTKKVFTATSPTVGTAEDPEVGKIYIDLSDNTTWRWSGTALVQMNGGIVLGDTSTTAYRGDRGKIAYDHSQTTGNPHNTQITDISGLGAQLAGKANIRLDNIPANLTAQEKLDFRNKIGAGTSSTSGTVTSVALTAPLGFSVAGSPITSSGTFALTFAAGYSLPTTAKQTQWDAAYTNSQALGDATQAVPDWSAQLTSQVTF